MKPFSVVYGEQVRRLRQQVDELVERKSELEQLTADAVMNIDEIEKSQGKHLSAKSISISRKTCP